VSVCPYGRCYGYDKVRVAEHGAYPQLAAFLNQPSVESTRWYTKRSGTGLLDHQLYYDPAAHRDD
jgi:hypothetical protein